MIYLDGEAQRKLLRDALHAGAVSVVFEKRDGTLRTMRCTLDDQQVVPYEPKGSSVSKVANDDVCPVWDLELSAWRSFRFDSVKEIL